MTKLNKTAASVARVYLPFSGFYESVLMEDVTPFLPLGRYFL